MEISIKPRGFNSKVLAVRTAGFWSRPKLLVGGVPAARKKRVYTVLNDAGQAVTITLRNNFLDPVPTVVVGSETIELARPLSWREYAWIGLPVLLVFGGGAIGAGFGLAAIYSSARIFREERSTRSKYLLTGLISAGAFITFLVLAFMLQFVLHDS